MTGCMQGKWSDPRVIAHQHSQRHQPGRQDQAHAHPVLCHTIANTAAGVMNARENAALPGYLCWLIQLGPRQSAAPCDVNDLLATTLHGIVCHESILEAHRRWPLVWGSTC
jgi:citrate lyase beta subunit